MKKLITFSLVAACTLAIPASAQEAAPASPHTVTGNFSLTSQYVFRGLAQTNGRPAIQGGYDYAHACGFYAGLWASNVSWISDVGAGDSSSIETDVYLGYKLTFAKDFILDIGAIEYYYPGKYADATIKPHTTEAYLGFSYKWITAKYSHTVSSDFFGFKDFKNTKYYELNANVPLPKGITLAVHAGRQDFSVSSSDLSYTDYKLGLSKEIAPTYTLGVAYTYADTKEAFWTNAFGNNYGGGRVALTLGKTF
jgi:uncharacterized protein (TIGR02001 family)